MIIILIIINNKNIIINNININCLNNLIFNI